MIPENLGDDIAAISTAPGTGAIAIVRISGPNAWAIVQSIFRAQSNIQSVNFEPRQASHGYIIDQNDNIVDEVVVITYKSPNSYTGLDLVEINCHGSIVISNNILQLLLDNGARLAQKGEFTKQAFLNGKLDLIQAEAVLDLIQAKTVKSGIASLSILKGHLGNKIKKLRQALINHLTNIVARIDFPDEVEELDTSNLGNDLTKLKIELTKLAKTATTGIFLRQGVKIAIVGNPNVGKSSLLNQLLNFERAIVTPQAGTTRDFIEEPLDLKGIPVILIDTAGIRNTSDEVEKIGINRSIEAVNQADLILLMQDITVNSSIEPSLTEKLSQKPYFILNNKTDLIDFNANILLDRPLLNAEIINNHLCQGQINISAKTGQGIDNLINSLETWINHFSDLEECGGSLNQRQASLCRNASDSILNAIDAIANDLPLDCISTDLKEAINSLSQVCGIEVSQEIINNVFANFCVGK